MPLFIPLTAIADPGTTVLFDTFQINIDHIHVLLPREKATLIVAPLGNFIVRESVEEILDLIRGTKDLEARISARQEARYTPRSRPT